MLLHNPWDTPCVYTEDGRTLEAFGRQEVDALDSVGQEAVNGGWITVKASLGPPSSKAGESDRGRSSKDKRTDRSGESRTE